MNKNEISWIFIFDLFMTIFDMSFWCPQIDQKSNRAFVRISALASKRGGIKKAPNCNLKKIKFLYLFDSAFLETRADIFTKINLLVLGLF